MALDPKTLVKGVRYRLTPKPGQTSVSGSIHEGVFLGSKYFYDTPPDFPHLDIKLDRGRALVFPSKPYNITKVPITTPQDRLNKEIVMGELLGSPGGKDYEEAKARWSKTAGKRRHRKRKTKKHTRR
jgi:hypothetical protein